MDKILYISHSWSFRSKTIVNFPCGRMENDQIGDVFRGNFSFPWAIDAYGSTEEGPHPSEQTLNLLTESLHSWGEEGAQNLLEDTSLLWPGEGGSGVGGPHQNLLLDTSLWTGEGGSAMGEARQSLLEGTSQVIDYRLVTRFSHFAISQLTVDTWVKS